MSKKYMDFAPVRQKSASKGTGTTRKTVTRQAAPRVAAAGSVAPKVTVQRTTPSPRAATLSSRAVASSSKAVTPRLIRSTEATRTAQTSKETRVLSSRTKVDGADQSVFSIRGGSRLGEIEDLNPRFVRTDVPKRPLSKNVYQKKVEAPKESANKKPVTIITKPKKESRAGVVIAIILTIILGAVAGTVAFLLLPK